MRAANVGAAATGVAGVEPPAVANLLAHRGRVTPDAVAATLLDLAARRRLTLEEIRPGTYLCRLRTLGADRASLTPYEAQVLDLLDERASVAGTVATPELSPRSGEPAAGWHRAFARLVTEDARQRGLLRAGWAVSLPAVGGSALAASAVATACALVVLVTLATVAGLGAARAGLASPALGAVAAVLLVTAVLLGAVASSALAAAQRGTLRLTPAGRAAARSWRAAGRRARAVELLRAAPPPAVAIWGRVLAYGVALGACPGAAAALDTTTRREDTAWSAHAGRWRDVVIEYPRRAAEGRSPARAALGAAARVSLGAAFAGTLAPAVGPLVGDVRALVAAGPLPGWLGALGATAAALPLLCTAALVAGGAVTLARAVGDLCSEPVAVEGQVLRVPWRQQPSGGSWRWAPTGFTAVDDGRGPVVRALRFQHPEATEGSVVRLAVTPRLRHVRSCEVLRPARPDNAAGLALAAPAAPAPPSPSLPPA